MGSYFIHVKLR